MNAKNGTIYIVLTALAFGTMEIALKIAGSSFTAFQLTFLRFFIGGSGRILHDLLKSAAQRGIADPLPFPRAMKGRRGVLGFQRPCRFFIVFAVGPVRPDPPEEPTRGTPFRFSPPVLFIPSVAHFTAKGKTQLARAGECMPSAA